MPQKTIKCYGLQIDTAEVFLNVPNGKMTEFLEGQDPVKVCQDPDGQLQIILFRKKDQVKAALTRAQSLGFDSAMICNTLIYVPESDMKGDKE